MLIGAYIGGGPRFYMNGIIDEVGIFDKAISQDEIDYIYNNNNGRDFFNLNTPAVVSTQNIEYTFDVGESDIYMFNLFNFDIPTNLFYEFDLYYYDYVTEQFETLTDGFSSVASEGYRFDNADGILTVEYFGLETETTFDGSIIATDTSTGATDEIFVTFTFPEVASISPPYRISPLTSVYDANINGDIPISVLYNINSHYGNYTSVDVEYYDVSGLVQLTNTIFTGTSDSNTENLSVDLYSENANVFLNISGVDGKTFDNTLFIKMYNSAGQLNETINIKTNTPSNLQYLSIPDFDVEIGDTDGLIVDFNNYFENITQVNLTYINPSNETITITNALPCDNVSCPLMIEGTNKNTYDDYIIGVDGELKLIFSSLQNELNLSVTVEVTDFNVGSGIDTFIISTLLEVIDDSFGSQYYTDWKEGLFGLFPDESTLTSFQKTLYVVITLFLIGFLVFLLMRNIDLRIRIFTMLVFWLLSFLLYASINYISIGVIIITALIIGILLFFKARNI